jgi:hypothetical protein
MVNSIFVLKNMRRFSTYKVSEYIYIMLIRIKKIILTYIFFVMKLFKNLFKIKPPEDTVCEFHSEKKLPNLRPLGMKYNDDIEYCAKCKISICYHCGNEHLDRFCEVECKNIL